MDTVSERIIRILKESKKLSTYEIAKKAKISWATANLYCYKLMAEGILANKSEELKVNSKRIVWWLK